MDAITLVGLVVPFDIYVEWDHSTSHSTFPFDAARQLGPQGNCICNLTRRALFLTVYSQCYSYVILGVEELVLIFQKFDKFIKVHALLLITKRRYVGVSIFGVSRNHRT